MKQVEDIAVFDHKLNIVRGLGRVIYADKETTKLDGTVLPPGWVLPGGRRTLYRPLAEAVADEIHAITARQMKQKAPRSLSSSV